MKDKFEQNFERYRTVTTTPEYGYWQSIYTKCFWFAFLAIIGLAVGSIRLLLSVQKGIWLIGICTLMFLMAAIGMAIARSNRKNILKSNAIEDPFHPAPVDTSGLPWCRNCSHFRPLKHWNSNSDGPWQGSGKPVVGELPCLIAEQVACVWNDYFAQPPAKRTLFPKTCDRFDKRL